MPWQSPRQPLLRIAAPGSPRASGRLSETDAAAPEHMRDSGRASDESRASDLDEMGNELRRSLLRLCDVCVPSTCAKQEDEREGEGRESDDTETTEEDVGVGSDCDGWSAQAQTETLARLSGEGVVAQNAWILTYAPRDDVQFERFASAVKKSVLSGQRSSASSRNTSRPLSGSLETTGTDSTGIRDECKEGGISDLILSPTRVPEAEVISTLSGQLSLFDIPRSTLHYERFSSNDMRSSKEASFPNSTNDTSDADKKEEEKEVEQVAEEEVAESPATRIVLTGSPFAQLDASTAAYVLSSIERCGKLARSDRSRAEQVLDETLELLRPSRVQEHLSQRRSHFFDQLERLGLEPNPASEYLKFDEPSVCLCPVAVAQYFTLLVNHSSFDLRYILTHRIHYTVHIPYTYLQAEVRRDSQSQARRSIGAERGSLLERSSQTVNESSALPLILAPKSREEDVQEGCAMRNSIGECLTELRRRSTIAADEENDLEGDTSVASEKQQEVQEGDDEATLLAAAAATSTGKGGKARQQQLLEAGDEELVREEARLLHMSTLAADEAIALYTRAVDVVTYERDAEESAAVGTDGARRSSFSSRFSDSFASLPSILEVEDEQDEQDADSVY